jgi:hypothetical protein
MDTNVFIVISSQFAIAWLSKTLSKVASDCDHSSYIVFDLIASIMYFTIWWTTMTMFYIAIGNL